MGKFGRVCCDCGVFLGVIVAGAMAVLAAYRAPWVAEDAPSLEMVQILTVPPLPRSDPATQGAFGPEIPWPIVMIHAAVMPDGRVLTFGTDWLGEHGSAWTPSIAPIIQITNQNA